MKKKKRFFGAPFAPCLLEISRARMCISPAPQDYSQSTIIVVGEVLSHLL